MQKLINAKAELLETLMKEISKLNNEKVIYAIDGKSCSGKTTLSEFLSENIAGLSVVQMDDFYLPFEKRTENWKDIPCANIDFERLLSEIINPFLDGEETKYFALNPHEDIMSYKGKITSDILIIEGSYSEHPLLSPYYSKKIFLEISDEIQLQRLKKREGENFENFYSLWVKLENEYFDKYKVKENADIIYDNR